MQTLSEILQQFNFEKLITKDDWAVLGSDPGSLTDEQVEEILLSDYTALADDKDED